MFEVYKENCYITADREQILRLMMSFNEPMVAPSQHPAQPTDAYICTLKEEGGFSVYIYLYLTVEKVGILYKYTDAIKSIESCRSAEEEAVHFVEDTGHIIDDLNFTGLDISEQKKVMASIPLFAKTEASEKVPSDEEVIEAIEPVEEPKVFLSKFRIRIAENKIEA